MNKTQKHTGQPVTTCMYINIHLSFQHFNATVKTNVVLGVRSSSNPRMDKPYKKVRFCDV